MSIIEIKGVNATPFITKTGFQKTEITLINKGHKISLWTKIAVGNEKPSEANGDGMILHRLITTIIFLQIRIAKRLKNQNAGF